MFSFKLSNFSKITCSSIVHYAKILDTFLIPSCTPFTALKQFVFLSDASYTQCLTWDRKTWLPDVTPLRKLKAFISLSVLLLVNNHVLFYILTNEVVGYHKDPELTLAATLLLVIALSLAICAFIASQIYAFKGKTVCFIYRNVETLRQICQPEIGKFEFIALDKWNN